MTARSQIAGIVRVVQHQPEPSARSPSGVSGPAARTTPACPPDCCSPPGGTNRAAPIRPCACDAPCVDLAWVSPRSWSWESHPARVAGALPSAPDTSDARADNVERSTMARSSTRIPAQATRSNIQSGTSCQRPGAASSTAHRVQAMPALSTTSRTRTRRPLQGCHGYRIVRVPVLWAVSRSVVQRRTPARQLGIPATGSGDDCRAKSAALLGHAPPATQLGREASNALTFELDQSTGAGKCEVVDIECHSRGAQNDATSRAANSEDMG